ncbi:MAG: ComEA family DNA-binding protein [Lachnospiraceae bacterium]|nr:ComEA family DNA-binding protein [Lachnospiraceae bacterium]
MNKEVKWNREMLFGILCLGALWLCGCDGQGQTIEEMLIQEQVYEVEETCESVAETGEEIPTLWVHICGYVQIPGIYELPEGSRVYDGLMAAGGFAKGADETALNLADFLQDGSQIYVTGMVLEEGNENAFSDGNITLSTQTGNAAGKGKTNAPNQLVNINTATLEQLKDLPGIGEKRARDIVSYRESNGPFASIEDIQKISGIKAAIYEKIKDLITVR